jgi:ubiquinone/menaquinone biosynthesis C-methylase UbiE
MGLPMDGPIEERVLREKAFHNDRFSQEVRTHQDKYYFAIERGTENFRDHVRALSKDAVVLEYGCGIGENALQLAPVARSVVGIDISEVGVERANVEAKIRGLGNASFKVMDAERLAFPDASFDLVFGVGIVHHLDVSRSIAEIRRILRPNGVALFWEPLGHNPIINFYRHLTPSARTADEHPLLRQDFELVKRIFPKVTTRHCGLISLAAVPLKSVPGGRQLRDALDSLDQKLFAIGPLRWLSWYVEFEMRP